MKGMTNMRNNSFFEKLTGSLRLSDDDLNALNEPSNQIQTKDNNTKSITSKKEAQREEVIEEYDDGFEIPDDAEIETIEEVIEDDSISEEEVEEYYEEIIDEEDDNDEQVSLYGDEDRYGDDVVVSNTKDDYPVFHLASEEKKEDLIKTEKHEETKTAPQIELPVDVFEMHNEVVLRVLVPGITPENLKVSITRDHVSLTCTRPSPDGINDSSYFEREIPYGEFTRMIHLPSDVDVEHAEAVEKYGLLIIRLPRLDAKKVQELKIRSV